MVRYLLTLYLLVVSFVIQAQEYDYTYNFFYNSAMSGDHFFSATENNNGSFVFNRNFKIPVSETVFHTPGNSLRLVYINAKGGDWKATIFRQERRGMDNFKKAAYLSFWIYNTTVDSPYTELPVFQLMRNDSSLTEKMTIKEAVINTWKQVTVPVSSLKGVDQSRLPIGIVFSQPNGSNSKKHTMYVDDIEFLTELNSKASLPAPEIKSAKGYAMHVDLQWNKPNDSKVKFIRIYRCSNGKDFIPVGIQEPYTNRYADYTGSTGANYQYKISYVDHRYDESKLSPPVTASTRAMSDDELLTMVQEASFRYYWEGAEYIPGRHNMIASGASGFGIMALIAGTERKFISRSESVARFEKILGFLQGAQTFHGAFPHFINGTNGKVETFFGKRDNGADLVETSFLLQGLLAARQYFSGTDSRERSIRDKITSIWEKVDWNWFKQSPESKFLYWHWSPDQAWAINHKLIGWNETMVTYLLAIASPSHPVAAAMYYTGWANQDLTGQEYRSAWGKTKDGSMYTNGNTYYGNKLDVGVSNGGPLFFTHYSYMGYDPKLITDNYTNYFRNNQKIAKINHRYCVENPKKYLGYGDDSWGLTASDGPFSYSADEPVPHADHGKIAPTGAISSFPYTPEESLKALKNYYFNNGKFLWGEYGFRDAFDLTNNWCSEIYMGLNQAPMTVMIENYRTGLIWKLFMRDPDVKAGMEKLQQETYSRRKRKQSDN
jgi:exo beta-1,2-glucooligosaccharide sophorohydrolase (non-reducing end)